MLFKPSASVIVGFFLAVSLIVLAIRKLAYELYNWFPNSERVYEFQWKREFQFYWSDRAYFSTLQLLRLYALWILARFDKYFPFIDCERQAAKAQYFHEKGRYVGMSSFAFRYCNLNSWPILLVRRFVSLLFPSFFTPVNQVVNELENQPSANEHKSV